MRRLQEFSTNQAKSQEFGQLINQQETYFFYIYD